MTAIQLRPRTMRSGGNVLRKIFAALEATRRYVREVFPEQPDPILIAVLHEEHLLRQAWSVLCPTEEEATRRRTERGMPSTLEQEWAAQVIAEHTAFAAQSGLSRQMMKELGTADSRHVHAPRTRRDVIALFRPEIPSGCSSVAPNV